MATVHLRYWAAAEDAAGAATASYPAQTLNEALTQAGRDHPRLAQLLPGCAVLRDGVRVPEERRDDPLGEDIEVEVLPPFAGG
ncbi:MoaD/ThiS family protein [Enemella sp. A6]|uniref:MoaD/ThiS family protein n=1 Tax=Enemella sp. A6 TaxID=3440152 RepID=UPI003EC1437A